MTNPAEVARKLTKAQRRIVCELPIDGSFASAGDFCRQRRTRMALTNSGVTEPERKGSITMFFSIRLTPLGLAVRTHLENTDAR